MASMGFDSSALSEKHPDFSFMNAVRDDDRVYVSGQISIDQCGTIVEGKVWADGSKSQTALEGAELCIVRCLRAAASVVKYEDITKVLEMLVIVHCEDGFEDIPRVADSASELLIDLLGEEVGMGTRMAFGAILPFGAIVEIKMTLKVAPVQ